MKERPETIDLGFGPKKMTYVQPENTVNRLVIDRETRWPEGWWIVPAGVLGLGLWILAGLGLRWLLWG